MKPPWWSYLIAIAIIAVGTAVLFTVAMAIVRLVMEFGGA